MTALFFATRPKSPDRATLRAEELARLRFVAARLTRYAHEYHRPAFRFDSVTVHLDSTRAAEFRSYLTDLWGDSIGYYWNYATFHLWSDAGMTSAGRAAALDSAMRQAHLLQEPNRWTNQVLRTRLSALLFTVYEKLNIYEEYSWPEVAQRDSMRLKQRERDKIGQSTHDQSPRDPAAANHLKRRTRN